jgi:regulator of sirC expression with transglutaminase-like and TPR domain
MSDALKAFAAEARRADADLDLARAALLIAAGEYPDLALDTCIALIDEIGARVRAALGHYADAREIAHAVRRTLFHDLEFRGNDEEYYDPRNSYLNDVLVRRRGIPISLAVIYLEVARRAGLEAHGVSYPRHFLVKYHDPGGREWLVDPFHGGEEFLVEHFRGQMVRGRGTPEQVVDYYLSAATRRQILGRMLLNLKLIYGQAGDDGRALRTQEYILALTPWAFEEMRDRGRLRARTGDVAGAVADLETYLAHAGAAEDVPAVRDLLARLRG